MLDLKICKFLKHDHVVLNATDITRTFEQSRVRNSKVGELLMSPLSPLCQLGLLAGPNDSGLGIRFTAPNTEREQNYTRNHKREIDHTARRSALGFDCLVRADPKPHRVFKRKQHVEKRDKRPVTDRCKQVDQADYQLRQPPQPENPNHRFSRACLLYTSPSPRDGLLSRMPSSA